MIACDALVIPVLGHMDSGFVCLPAETAVLAHPEAGWSFVANRALAGIRFIPAVTTHTVSDRLFHDRPL